MQNEHEWKERTPEGEKRIFRATKFGGKWKFQSKLKGEEYWTLHDPPLLDDLIELYDVLFRKYQRRRVPYEDTVQIRDMIEAMGGHVPK